MAKITMMSGIVSLTKIKKIAMRSGGFISPKSPKSPTQILPYRGGGEEMDIAALRGRFFCLSTFYFLLSTFD